MNFFVITICQCHLPNRKTVNMKRSMWQMSLRQRTGSCPGRKLKETEKKFLLSAILFVVLSGLSKDSLRSPLTVPVRWVACKGGLCFNPSSLVARLARAPSLHVKRPLISTWKIDIVFSVSQCWFWGLKIFRFFILFKLDPPPPLRPTKCSIYYNCNNPIWVGSADSFRKLLRRSWIHSEN